MTLQLNQILIKSATRVRLIFSGALASGAFNASKYSISNVTLDGTGPTVDAALAVAGFTNQVELVLNSELGTGNTYAANCTSVPAADASTFTGSAASFWGQSVIFTPNVEPAQNQGDALAFGRDLVHNGNDYVEDATGDLATVEGIPNVQGALFRRVVSYALPWDASYGARLDDYVDGPNAQAAPAAGLIKKQMLADNRTQSATVTLEEDDTGGAFFRITPVLKTDKKIGPFDVAVTDVFSSDA